MEIIALGLAVIIPALLVLSYGKEAALGAISGGFNGVAKYFEERGKSSSNAEKEIEALGKRKTEFTKNDLDIQKKLKDSKKFPELEKLVQENGYKKLPQYKTAAIIVDPDFGAYLKGNLTESDAKTFNKDWPEDRKTFVLQKEINQELNEIVDVMQILKEENPGYFSATLEGMKGWDFFNFTKDAKGFIPKSDVMINGKLEKVNLLQHLDASVNKFKSSYVKFSNLGGKLNENLVNHMDAMLTNPSNPKAWKANDASDMQNKFKNLLNTMNREFVNSNVIKGYLEEPLKEKYPFSNNKAFHRSDNLQTQIKQGVKQGKFKIADLSPVITE